MSPPLGQLTRSPKTRRVLRIGTTLLVLGLCALLARRLDWAGAVRALAGARWGWLTLACLLNFPFLLLQSIRWQRILKPAGEARLTALFRYLLASRAASNLLPARAGELLRVYLLRTRDDFSAVTVTSTLIIERFFDAFGLALLASPLLFIAGTPSWVRTGVLILVVLAASGLVATLLLARRGSQDCRSTFDRVALAAEVMKSPPQALAVTAVTLICWLTELAMVLSCLAAVRLPATPQAAILILLAVNLGMILQVTPGNVGLFEATVILALAVLGITGPQALALALLYHLVQVVPVTLAGLEGLRFLSEARAEEKPPEVGGGEPRSRDTAAPPATPD